ncbi:MAG: DNA translocase FtsK 4TM domain-containing protein [Candidatus Dojkabacteria bacterium]
MPRKKKKQTITIQSSETKILFGIIVFLAGLIVTCSLFIPQQSRIFDEIALKLGYSSIAWGIFLIYISFFLLTKNRRFISMKQATGLFLFSASLSILLSFWQIDEQLNSSEALRGSGGEIGKLFHLSVNGLFGSFIEIVVVLILLIISFSLITGTTLAQIRDFLESSIPEDKNGENKVSGLSSFLKKMGFGESDDIEIGNNSKQGSELQIESEEEIQRRLDEIMENPSEGKNDTVEEVTSEEFDINQIKDVPIRKKEEENKPQRPKYLNWIFPNLDILQEGTVQEQDKKLYKQKALIIEQTLRSFGIQAKVVQISVGPTVLRFSLSVSVGTKVSKIKNLSNDLALALASQTSSVRIEAPIPGTSFVGVEIPNPTPNFVYIKDMVKRLKLEESKYELPLILGKDITGKTAIKDLAKIPHLLVAGATGTGKSVAMNSLITGLLMTKSPDEVKFIMIDPKMGVEMALYNGIPHLLNPVITDSELVPNVLQWTIEEMMRRYRQLKQVHAKKLTEYNTKMGFVAMPYIVIVIDEMADLILTSGIEVEKKIQRLAQMGRAVGVHLILATQKPTVNVITGLIKSNIPGRMAFAVATALDSRVILDEMGAETLLGNGDMLYKDQTTPKSLRIQGTWTATEDSENVINAVKSQVKEEEIEYSEDLTQALEKGTQEGVSGHSGDRDPDFGKALEIVVLTKKASASFLQRKMRIGYNKAARLVDELYEAGAIGPEDGAKPRQVLISSAEDIDKEKKDDE